MNDDPLEGLDVPRLDRIEAALDSFIARKLADEQWERERSAREFRRARSLLVHHLRNPWIPRGHMERDMRRRLCLVRPIDGLIAETVYSSPSRGRGGFRLKAPFGWRFDYEAGRDVVLLMPAWVYWPRRLWMMRYSIVFRPLDRIGFWSIEGGYYAEGRWTWAWWRTLDERRCTRDTRGRLLPPTRWTEPSRWERFGWWIQAQLDAFSATYPRWDA